MRYDKRISKEARKQIKSLRRQSKSVPFDAKALSREIRNAQRS